MERKISLKSIRFTNFKSYKEIQEAGPCHPKINTIIGPNGSGKSNFLDAILFVLGKRAGQIRFKKLSDLINISTSNLSKFGTVSLIFIKEFKKIFEKNLISNEIIFSRQIFLNNTSIYYLNGQEVSLVAMNQSLKIAGILNKNDRFLIQQGEIEKISTMKPKNDTLTEIGLLEYSEDSFGSSRYLKTINKKKIIIFNIVRNLKIKKEFLKKKNLKKIFSTLIPPNSKNYFRKKFYVLKFLIYLNSIRRMEISSWKIKNQEKEIEIKNFWKLYNLKFWNFKKDKKKCKRIFKDLQKKNIASKNLSIFLEKWFLSLKKKDFLLKQEFEFISKKISFKYFSKNKREKEFRNERFENFRFFLGLYYIRNKKKRKMSFFDNLSVDPFQFIYLEGFYENFFGNFRINFIYKNFQKIFSHKQKIDLFFFKKKNPSFIKRCDFKKIHSNDQNKKSTTFSKIHFVRNKILTFFFPKFKKKIYKITKSLEKIIISKDLSVFVSKKLLIFFFKLRKTKIFSQGQSNKKEKIIKKKFKKRFEKFKKLTFFSLNEINCFFCQTKSIFPQNLFLTFRNLFPIETNKKYLSIKKNIPGVMEFIGSLGFLKILNLVAFYNTLSGYISTILIDNSLNCSNAINFLKKNKIGRINFLVHEQLNDLSRSRISDKENPKNYLRNLIYCKKKHQPIFDFILKDTVIVKNLSEGLFYGSTNKRKLIITQDGKVIETSGIFSGGGTSSKILSFLIAHKKKKMKWMNKFDFFEFLLKSFLTFDIQEFHCFSKFKKVKKNFFKQTTKRLNVFFFLKSALRAKNLNLDLKIEKKSVKNFQKKIMLSEIKKYISKAFFRTIDLRLGEEIFLINFLKKRIEKKNESIYFLKKINKKIKIDLIKIYSFEKKVYACGILRKSFQYKYQGSSLKKKFKISKFFQNFSNFFFFILFEKYIYLTRFEKIFQKYNSFKRCVLKKKNFFFEQKKKHFFELKCRMKSEIKKYFLFWQKFKKYFFFEIFNKNSFLYKKKGEKIFKKKLSLKSSNFWLFQKKLPMTFFLSLHSLEPFSNFCPYSFFCYYREFEEFLINQSKNSLQRNLFSKKVFIEKIYSSFHIQRLSEFLQDLFIFDYYLKIIFSLISKRGEMEINLVDSMDPFLEGVFLSVKPPQKTWKTVSYLSGGEKTLSSLAVVFSLQELKFSPWYLLDEIDAALDFRNVTKISSYLISHSQNAQILIVSLRNNILANSNQILGIYKISGETKTISLRNSI